MEPGFDGALAVHAAASVPVYAAAYAFTKSDNPIHPKLEMLAALAITIALNLGGELMRGQVAGTMEALLPLISSCTTGAMAAMMLHAAMFKKKGLDLPPVEELIAKAPPGYVEHVVRLSVGGSATSAAASALTKEP